MCRQRLIGAPCTSRKTTSRSFIPYVALDAAPLTAVKNKGNSQTTKYPVATMLTRAHSHFAGNRKESIMPAHIPTLPSIHQSKIGVAVVAAASTLLYRGATVGDSVILPPMASPAERGHALVRLSRSAMGSLPKGSPSSPCHPGRHRCWGDRPSFTFGKEWGTHLPSISAASIRRNGTACLQSGSRLAFSYSSPFAGAKDGAPTNRWRVSRRAGIARPTCLRERIRCRRTFARTVGSVTRRTWPRSPRRTRPCHPIFAGADDGASASAKDMPAPFVSGKPSRRAWGCHLPVQLVHSRGGVTDLAAVWGVECLLGSPGCWTYNGSCAARSCAL